MVAPVGDIQSEIGDGFNRDRVQKKAPFKPKEGLNGAPAR